MSKAQKEQDDERKETPVAPPVPPPTPPQSSRNPSSLLSPWWSAEPPPERPSDAKKNHYVFMNFSVTTSAKKPGTEGNTPEDQVVLTKESCFMLAKKEALQNQPDDAPANSPYVGTSDCRMICFLRESEHLLKLREAEQHQQQQRSWNPFRGTWLVVATTRQRCMEHSFSDDSKCAHTQKAVFDGHACRFSENTVLMRCISFFLSFRTSSKKAQSVSL